ncbi:MULTISPECIES: phage baseplate assembly protein V [Pasteurellaceae]|uniref:Phage baseplate assembly protein V n=1 Tax=Pasteurella atlantica TaxID=2827233 RepID=A0AAW8CUV0_9PAST|nr:phage baseplate assembly protein V [Pasteurella atlantica]MBR0573353.1 phage baseplate assembly protein V [Pasteurella atlantica]MDP8040465.1 phage baseplate assembly protein V [Pasteurella atlantica]MDP8041856.1 phage baseplate assembly protein V [Pasteurella atlantica]MDP8043923.1 phage baseplate assembly protein V [Pasteurella atlantica]MDP8046798.1 phage baseplate assembly protein V [Pasteurella atlantica]
MNFTLSDLSRRLEHIVRLGTIEKVDLKKALVRVKTGDILTDWLPILSLRAGTTRTWSPPTKGEQCIVLSASGEMTTAVVLYGIYASNAPSTNGDEHLIEFEDGAICKYNQKTHRLEMTGIATAYIQASKSVTADTPYFECTGDAHIGGKLTVGSTIKAGGDISSDKYTLNTHYHTPVVPPIG